MNKKAQAAMEFMMTYGWAILIILVVIGVISYLGVTSYNNYAPEKCELFPGLNCVDHVITQRNVLLVVKNNYGSDLNITFASDGCHNWMRHVIRRGETRNVLFVGCENNGDVDRKFYQRINMSYKVLDGIKEYKAEGYATGMLGSLTSAYLCTRAEETDLCEKLNDLDIPRVGPGEQGMTYSEMCWQEFELCNPN
jgi:hypothetical protein